MRPVLRLSVTISSLCARKCFILSAKVASKVKVHVRLVDVLVFAEIELTIFDQTNALRWSHWSPLRVLV